MSPVRNDLFEKPIGDSLVLAFADEYGLPDIGHACCLEGVAVDVWNLLKSLIEGLESSYFICVRLIAIQKPYSQNVTGRNSIAYNANPSRGMRILVEHRVPLEPNRYGQRREHVSIKSGKGFSNYVFTFSYLERPPTSFQLAFLSSLLGLLVLFCTILIHMWGQNQGSINAGILGAFLSVVSAAGGWVTTRSRDGRGIQVAPWVSGCVSMLTSAAAISANVMDAVQFVPFDGFLHYTLVVACVVQGTNTLSTLWACAIRGLVHHKILKMKPACINGRYSGLNSNCVPAGKKSSESALENYQGGWFSGSHAREWYRGFDGECSTRLDSAFKTSRSFVRDILFFADKGKVGSGIINYLHERIITGSVEI